MSLKEGITATAVGIAGIVGLAGLSYVGLQWSGFMRGEAEKIRYDVHKESQAYRDGMQRNLSQLHQDYVNADAAGRQVIILSVRHQYSQTDTSEYPAFLQSFLSEAGVY